MRQCPQCGFYHSEEDARCIRCGALLRDQGRLDPLAAPGHEPIDLRPVRSVPGWNLVLRAMGRLRRGWFFVRRALHSDAPAGVHFRNPWLAGALGLVPGLGQLYNHQPKRAALLGGVVLAFFAVAAATWYQPFSNWVLLAALMVWLYGFHDAFMTAKAINRDVVYWTTTVAFYLAWMFLICFAALTGQFVLGAFLIKFRHLGHNEMAPFLRRGERIALNRWDYIWHKPRVGDVVYVTNYDAAHPRELSLEWPSAVQSNTILVQQRNYVERVVGEPGDTFERRAGKFFRNGQPVPKSEEPIVQDQIPWDFKLQAPPGRYIVLMSYTGEDIDPTMVIVKHVTPTGYTDTAASQKTYSTDVHVQAPRMNHDGWIARNWGEQNYVPLKDIEARVWFVYNPPPARRWVD